MNKKNSGKKEFNKETKIKEGVKAQDFLGNTALHFAVFRANK